MTLEQAYKKVHMMDEVLDSDILNDEEYTSVAKRRFKLMELIGLEEQRQKQLETYNPIETYRPKLSDWERGFLDGFVIQGHKCHYITERQKTVLHLIVLATTVMNPQKNVTNNINCCIIHHIKTCKVLNSGFDVIDVIDFHSYYLTP